jgi:hypothetical protein
MNPPVCFVAASAVALILTGTQLGAQADHFWTGDGLSDNWSDGLNWLSGSAPLSGHIDADGLQ